MISGIFFTVYSLIHIYIQIVGGSEHTLRAKLTFNVESHGRELFVLPEYSSVLIFMCYAFLCIKSLS